MTDSEINEAVARKMGWIPINDGRWRRDDLNELGSAADIPDYCHSIAAAWEIVEKMGWIHMGCMKDLTIIYDCDEFELVRAHTAPMAICLAFLKLEEL